MADDAFRDKSDSELVAETLKNQDVFVFIVERYQAKLIRYIKRISGVSHEEAEDQLQEVFIKAYQHLNSFDQSLKFSSWIYRITHNQVISSFRKRQARPQLADWELNEEIFINILDKVDINKEVDISLLRGQINEVMASLDKKYQEVLYLRYFEDKEYADISDILKKPKGTVGTLISRAKKEFKKKMDKKSLKL